MTKTHKRPTNADGSPEELLGDLEFIRELLDEEEAAAMAASGESEPDRTGPPADQAVGDGVDDHSRRYLREDIFQTLLGDRWKTSASDILTEARGAIEAHRNQWTPEDTDELNEALRVRIDETLTEWLKATVAARLDELHSELLGAAQTVIDEKIQALVARRATHPHDQTG
ncbi:MAG TPA: hypothetical protein VIS76_02420 [Pseudomonadales bacterium]